MTGSPPTASGCRSDRARRNERRTQPDETEIVDQPAGRRGRYDNTLDEIRLGAGLGNVDARTAGKVQPRSSIGARPSAEASSTPAWIDRPMEWLDSPADTETLAANQKPLVTNAYAFVLCLPQRNTSMLMLELCSTDAEMPARARSNSKAQPSWKFVLPDGKNKVERGAMT